uniref:RRM domain-containing protein n=1 Tax=Chromera velia CCMP2878 TaxID=1169474 RepID=A0A0G4G149_9ALVE|eukprot:Cvel_19638.t1-p1 / transcript=Cvel_19638.t1 / gene=Cvel_19638 / organism=Chromera_velia_CCMP2878 / gene_product=Flowering time control protein FCA, putative / transcript_product=Flowering time control protein FCA, putative / location=Cvel_scaffold1710:12486-17926(+) / protein_length=1452 / sequence_SO=supercontig / SO=protein_coding / is_pseudo=false
MSTDTEFFRTFRTPADASGWLPPDIVASGRASLPVKIFVNRIPPKTKESTLIEYFRPYGKVLSVEILKRSGSKNLVAFVTMESVLSAHQAIAALHNRITLQSHGSPSRVVYAEHELERLQLPASLQPGHGSLRLFVGNLPAKVTIDRIATLFKPFGPLLEIHLLPAKGGRPAAFVVFRKFHDGLVAMGNLNGMKPPEGDTELTVRFAANEKLPVEWQAPQPGKDEKDSADAHETDYFPPPPPEPTLVPATASAGRVITPPAPPGAPPLLVPSSRPSQKSRDGGTSNSSDPSATPPAEDLARPKWVAPSLADSPPPPPLPPLSSCIPTHPIPPQGALLSESTRLPKEKERGLQQYYGGMDADMPPAILPHYPKGEQETLEPILSGPSPPTHGVPIGSIEEEPAPVYAKSQRQLTDQFGRSLGDDGGLAFSRQPYDVFVAPTTDPPFRPSFQTASGAHVGLQWPHAVSAPSYYEEFSARENVKNETVPTYEDISGLPFIKQPRDPLREEMWGYIAAEQVAAGWGDRTGPGRGTPDRHLPRHPSSPPLAPSKPAAAGHEVRLGGGQPSPEGAPGGVSGEGQGQPVPQGGHGAVLQEALSASALRDAVAEILNSTTSFSRTAAVAASTASISSHVSRCRDLYEESVRVQALLSILQSIQGAVHMEQRASDSDALSQTAGSSTAPPPVPAIPPQVPAAAAGGEKPDIHPGAILVGSPHLPLRGMPVSELHSTTAATGGTIRTNGIMSITPPDTDAQVLKIPLQQVGANAGGGMVPVPPPTEAPPVPLPPGVKRRQNPPDYYDDIFTTAAERYHCRRPAPGLPDIRNFAEDQLPWTSGSEVAYKEASLFNPADPSAMASAARGFAVEADYREGAAFHAGEMTGKWDSAAGGAYVEAPLKFGSQLRSTLRYGFETSPHHHPHSGGSGEKFAAPPFDPNHIQRVVHQQQEVQGQPQPLQPVPPVHQPVGGAHEFVGPLNYRAAPSLGTLGAPGEYIEVAERSAPHAHNLMRGDRRLAASSTPMDRPELFAAAEIEGRLALSATPMDRPDLFASRKLIPFRQPPLQQLAEQRLVAVHPGEAATVSGVLLPPPGAGALAAQQGPPMGPRAPVVDPSLAPLPPMQPPQPNGTTAVQVYRGHLTSPPLLSETPATSTYRPGVLPHQFSSPDTTQPQPQPAAGLGRTTPPHMLQKQPTQPLVQGPTAIPVSAAAAAAAAMQKPPLASTIPYQQSNSLSKQDQLSGTGTHSQTSDQSQHSRSFRLNPAPPQYHQSPATSGVFAVPSVSAGPLPPTAVTSRTPPPAARAPLSTVYPAPPVAATAIPATAIEPPTDPAAAQSGIIHRVGVPQTGTTSGGGAEGAYFLPTSIVSIQGRENSIVDGPPPGLSEPLPLPAQPPISSTHDAYGRPLVPDPTATSTGVQAAAAGPHNNPGFPTNSRAGIPPPGVGNSPVVPEPPNVHPVGRKI